MKTRRCSFLGMVLLAGMLGLSSAAYAQCGQGMGQRMYDTTTVETVTGVVTAVDTVTGRRSRQYQGTYVRMTAAGELLTVHLGPLFHFQQANNSLWIPAADVIVINGADVGYRAFSSICPHEREAVKIFEPSGGDGYQMRCPAHDWAFDVDGESIGRASAGLNQFSLTKADQTLRITPNR